jgi:hypothetical protein
VSATKAIGCHAGLDPASTLARQHGLRVKPAMTGTSNNPVERSGTTGQLSTVSAKMESCSSRRDTTEARSRTVFLFGQVLDKKGENGGCPQRGRALI